MSSVPRERVEQLFVELMEVEESRRESVLRERCDDEAVCREVLGLLGHHDQASNFLDSQALRRTRPAMESYEHWRRLRVGGYSILGVLGTGGMGLVYLAEQQRPRRKVALKVMRVGGNSRSLVTRFQREAELLGSLHHPGIAQVFEAGVAEQELEGGAAGEPLPYIAMEFVEGKPLGEYAAAARNGAGLSVRERVELVVLVCAAVEHAHLRGVIHRDLKPANILVNAEGQPKILDFGVARAMKQEGQAELERTMAGQMLGTLPYMSPEQVAGKSDEVDTRTDVYSVGVLLYELLCLEQPVDLRECGLEEAGRRIREVEPLPLGKRDQSLRGDLEAIAGKALEKDPQRRYQSIAELREDLQRHLAGEAVEARGDRTMYLARKRVRRYWKYYAAGVAAFAGLSAFAVYAYQQSVQQARATNEALAALSQARSAREAADDANAKLEIQLRTARVERARLLGVTGQRREAERLIWSEHLKRPDSRQTHWALWELYSRHACRYWTRVSEDMIERMALVPGTTMVVTAGVRGDVRLVETQSGREVRKFGNIGSPVVCIAATGRYVAAGGRLGQMEVWDLQSGEPVRLEQAHRQWINALAFVGDGSVLLSGGDDGCIRVWDMTEPMPREMAMVEKVGGGGPVPINQLRPHPDGYSMLVALGDGRLLRMDAASGEILGECKPHASAVLSMELSEDQRFVLTGGLDQAVSITSTDDMKLISRAGSGNGSVRSVMFLPGSEEFLVVGWSRVDIWDRERFKATGRTVGSAQGWRSGLLMPRGEALVLAADDGPGLTYWEMNPRVPAVDAELPLGVIDMRRMGDRVVTAVGGGAIVRRPGSAASSIFTVPGKRVRGVGVAGSVPGRAGGLIALAVDGGELRLLDGGTGSEVLAIKPESGEKDSPRNWGELSWPIISEDGAKGCAITNKRKLLLMDLKTGTVRQRDLGPGNMLMSSMDPGGRRVAIIHQNPGSVEIWDFDKGEMQARPLLTASALGLALSSDGTKVAVVGWDRLARVFDTQDGKEIMTLAGHTDLVLGVAFLDGDHELATASRDGAVRVWDLKTGDSLAMLPSASANIRFMRPLPDSVIAGVGWDGVVRYWDMRAYVPHILGNAAEQVGRFKADGGEADWTKVDKWLAGLRDWYDGVEPAAEVR